MSGTYQPDVIGISDNAELIYNGRAVVCVDQQGNKKTLDPKINSVPLPSAVFIKLQDRFDDPTYYG